MRLHKWAVVTLALASVAAPVAADVQVPPGFSTRVYVTGEGFDPDITRRGPGIPATSTLAVDHAGVLYLARTGRRYTAGEVEDLWPIYRIPLGGARLTPRSEASYLYGPPLPNAQVAVIRAPRDLFVTTFDRDRKLGVLYEMRDGRAELIAGGTPARGLAPLLRQPEGAAVDTAGNFYVADRAHNAIIKLDAAGRVLVPRYLSVARPRLVVVDEGNQLWVASDGSAEAPWQRGPGEIWKVDPQGAANVVLRGPVVAGMGLGPGGSLFVADRNEARIVVVGSDGRTMDFAAFTDGDVPRSLCFIPVTPETRRAGIAGDMVVVVVRRSAWPLNEVVRISGPFDERLRR